MVPETVLVDCSQNLKHVMERKKDKKLEYSLCSKLSLIRLRKFLVVCFFISKDKVYFKIHLVDIWNMIEAFRDNGLNTLDHSTEISVSRLETVISSIYYQLNKRLPSTHQISVEQSISLLLNFMIAAYDRLVFVECCLVTLYNGKAIQVSR
ncbi:hypothetical protein FD754_004263, partial [Muntiacus muntjak]